MKRIKILLYWKQLIFYFFVSYFLGFGAFAGAYWYSIFYYGASGETLETRLVQGGISGTILFLYWLYKILKS
jgi:hypothetical protein